VEQQTCGDNGCSIQQRTCGAQCTWGELGACTGNDECQAGVTETEACGDCGSRARTCSNQCLWPAFSACGGEGPCAAGTDETRVCGDCGTQSRTCSVECQWPNFGACENQGCHPGDIQEFPCNDCGTQSQSCSADCQWVDSGVCDNDPGEPGQCVDGNQCTTESCDGSGLCEYAYDPICCGDGQCLLEAEDITATWCAQDCCGFDGCTGDEAQLCPADCS
jgi:hypothetical protein